MKRITKLEMLTIQMDACLNRSDEADRNNNSWMAADSLDSYHRLKEEYDNLIERTKPLLENIRKEKVLEMCKSARQQLEIAQ